MSSWPGRMKSEGLEIVSIQLCTGSSVDIRVRYYRRSCDRRSGKRYKGVYAGLILLGIHDRCSPALASMVSSWSALLSSFEEVRQVLCDRGMKLGIKVIRKLTYRYAERARAEQQAGRIPLNDGDLLDGRRVVISTDGGRTRLREKKRGPKTKKDRTRFRGAWREPKLLIIYVVDAQGKQERSFSPFIDGCFNGPDGVFHLLQGYLNSLHIQDSDKILFVADGAHWIWNRIPELVKALGLAPDRVYELIDFYHAVEHLGTVAGLRKTWSSKKRKRWVSKQRGLLLKGKAVEVVQAVPDAL